MNFCCKSITNGKKDIEIERFKHLSEQIKRNNIPHTIDGDAIMICSPVGNQNKFIKSDKKADVVLSGYCTAPDAAISYINDVDKGVNDPELKNSFNTKNMQFGIRFLMDTIGFINVTNVLSNTLSPNIDPNFNMLFTQMLCMISKNGSPNANDVESILNSSEKIKAQAESSLKEWYERIINLVKPGGVILLMGVNSDNLINKSYIDENGNISIDFNNSKNYETVYDNLAKKYKIFNVMHAAAFQYNENKLNWLKNPSRIEINTYLTENFPNHFKPTVKGN